LGLFSFLSFFFFSLSGNRTIGLLQQRAYSISS
jgi:hypothetical protein